MLEGYRQLDAALAVAESLSAECLPGEFWPGALTALHRATLLFYAQVHAVPAAPLFSTSAAASRAGFIPPPR